MYKVCKWSNISLFIGETNNINSLFVKGDEAPITQYLFLLEQFSIKWVGRWRQRNFEISLCTLSTVGSFNPTIEFYTSHTPSNIVNKQ